MAAMDTSQHSETSLSYYGWVVLGMGFLANFVMGGFVYSYSVFFKPIAAEFGWSRSVIAGAFSVYAILHNILAFFAGRAVDKFGPRVVLLVAGLCLGISMIVMSHITCLWHLYIFFGVIFSMGVAATYVPIMTTVSWWFSVKRGLAIGLAAAGIGTGSLVFNPLSAWLISLLGWRNAYVTLGIIAWIFFIPIVVFIRQRLHEPAGEGEMESGEGLTFAQAFRTRTFWAYCLSWLFIALALFAIMIHLVLLLTDRGISIVTAGSIAGIIGGSSLAGRVSSGFLSDRFGRKRVYMSAMAFQLVTILWLLFSRDLWMFFVFAITFGLAMGAWTGVIAAFPSDYFGLRATGSILGFGIIMCGIGVAIGPYVGGYIFDKTHTYDYMIVMCIMATIASIIIASLIKPLKEADARHISHE